MNCRSFLIGILLVVTTAFGAQPPTRETTVHARPDSGSTVLQVLPAGASPVSATAPAEPAPAGWMAVEVPAPAELYVENKDVGKNFDVKTGSFFYLRADRRAPVVATMQAGDKAELLNLAGDFTSFSLSKPIVGYIKTGTTPDSSPAAGPAIVAPGPAAVGDMGHAPLPRFYEGRFSATQNFLTYRHPYNFQLVDSSGSRFAYLDISRLLLTDKVDLFLDRVVIVYGTARTINEQGTKRVIEVESLHLK